MRRKKKFPRKKIVNRKEIAKEVEKKVPMYFEYNKLGHVRAECP